MLAVHRWSHPALTALRRRFGPQEPLPRDHAMRPGEGGDHAAQRAAASDTRRRPACASQAAQALSIDCSAVFSVDCNVSPHAYFTVIHILL